MEFAQNQGGGRVSPNLDVVATGRAPVGRTDGSWMARRWPAGRHYIKIEVAPVYSGALLEGQHGFDHLLAAGHVGEGGGGGREGVVAVDELLGGERAGGDQVERGAGVGGAARIAGDDADFAEIALVGVERPAGARRGRGELDQRAAS